MCRIYHVAPILKDLETPALEGVENWYNPSHQPLPLPLLHLLDWKEKRGQTETELWGRGSKMLAWSSKLPLLQRTQHMSGSKESDWWWWNEIRREKTSGRDSVEGRTLSCSLLMSVWVWFLRQIIGHRPSAISWLIYLGCAQVSQEAMRAVDHAFWLPRKQPRSDING